MSEDWQLVKQRAAFLSGVEKWQWLRQGGSFGPFKLEESGGITLPNGLTYDQSCSFKNSTCEGWRIDKLAGEGAIVTLQGPYSTHKLTYQNKCWYSATPKQKTWGLGLFHVKPSRTGLLVSALPSLVMLGLFYSLAIHMYQHFGGWPTSTGQHGFPPALVAHATVAVAFCRDFMLLTHLVLPVVYFICLLVPKWRVVASYIGLGVLLIIVSFGLTMLAPQPFLRWWGWPFDSESGTSKPKAILPAHPGVPCSPAFAGDSVRAHGWLRDVGRS